MISDEHDVIADDPDLAHLFDLLRMLPGPRENRRFWAAVQAEGNLAKADAEEQVTYVYEKMSGITFLLRKPGPQRIVHLCKYLIHFFSGDRPDLWDVLDYLTSADGPDRSGQLWAKDITQTAWALYVRYHHFGDERWKEKWHFDDAWNEWLPDRE